MNYQEELRRAQAKAAKDICKKFLKEHIPMTLAYEIRKNLDQTLTDLADEFQVEMETTITPAMIKESIQNDLGGLALIFNPDTTLGNQLFIPESLHIISPHKENKNEK